MTTKLRDCVTTRLHDFGARGYSPLKGGWGDSNLVDFVTSECGANSPLKGGRGDSNPAPRSPKSALLLPKDAAQAAQDTAQAARVALARRSAAQDHA